MRLSSIYVLSTFIGLYEKDVQEAQHGCWRLLDPLSQPGSWHGTWVDLYKVPS